MKMVIPSLLFLLVFASSCTKYKGELAVVKGDCLILKNASYQVCNDGKLSGFHGKKVRVSFYHINECRGRTIDNSQIGPVEAPYVKVSRISLEE